MYPSFAALAGGEMRGVIVYLQYFIFVIFRNLNIVLF